VVGFFLRESVGHGVFMGLVLRGVGVFPEDGVAVPFPAGVV
jgi:hypothetical protein